MSSRPIPSVSRPRDESRRLARLRALAILDTPPEPRFDRIVELACHIFGVPMAAIGLVDEGRQWFKARRGIALGEIARDASFCAQTILGDEPLVIADAASDPRFASHPLVVGPPGIRFYAGTPITIDGHHVGSLCVLDRREQRPSRDMLRCLTDLAAIAADALQRHETEMRVAVACASRSAFLGVLSHEMRTPIGAVLGYLDLLGEELPPPERAEAREGISRNADRLLQLVDDMLELVQIESGATVPSITLIRPARLLHDLFDEFAVRARAKQVELTAEIRIAADLTATADPRHVRRAIASLLDNAVKFTQAGGTIRVEATVESATAETNVLRVFVTDSGIGLPPGDAEHLFLPFEVGDASMSRRFGGTGTGLAIARHFARASGGDVTLGPAPERGTVATITFVMGVPSGTLPALTSRSG